MSKRNPAKTFSLRAELAGEITMHTDDLRVTGNPAIFKEKFCKIVCWVNATKCGNDGTRGRGEDELSS
jgi:hypothetical protein